MFAKLKHYWPLIKSLQTGLLILTGLAGYVSARCPVYNLTTIVGLIGSLFLAVSGSTILNMVWDRDIDAKMNRTSNRPLPMGLIKPREAWVVGLGISILGLSWAATMDLLFAVVVFAGLFIDVVIYTMWLKRKTAWSIVWGGISGGMPILAGRVLGTGQIDGVGILFTFGILFWIPTHILTFSIKYAHDYAAADVPTFPSTYGVNRTRVIIAASSLFSAVSILVSGFLMDLTTGYLRLIVVLAVGLTGMAMGTIYNESERINFGLFKYASLFMMTSMFMVILGAR
ncbi:MAG: protoheme IX farnesyltransferase [Candidatus Marinimicrobia bacterium]|nr:protoheme IX farnesyltransferase [Candidatus Neomarinimicrobiota bacterium]MBT3576973.1 protoheme IX farnesyltransferase [Candidatus Neomarinimicrobiota bacterium]MBT3680151.1 protoheme IX farnesyltransferase [Candidatus Neomarinimicrobiota bacterium]MBT3951362.1 protoheme IX farnesyltransferase [Candidatus Neomarinimicrobiota bacterium]MBT4253937.1 protoheme IX farnesyltransferase [Candidatus Neomarinimicrobiota bacterium]